jgi:hypothetical protein
MLSTLVPEMKYIDQRFPNCGVRYLGGVQLVLWGEKVVFMRDIYFGRISAQDKMYFGSHFAWL